MPASPALPDYSDPSVATLEVMSSVSLLGLHDDPENLPKAIVDRDTSELLLSLKSSHSLDVFDGPGINRDPKTFRSLSWWDHPILFRHKGRKLLSVPIKGTSLPCHLGLLMAL